MSSARTSSHHALAANARSRVVVQLLGGLGNQMFQAAAGIALARKSNRRLAFDLSRFRAKGLRGYALAPFALEVDTIGLDGPDLLARGQRALKRMLGIKSPPVPSGFSGRVYQEPHFRFDPALFDGAADSDVLISGYFQSPLYFAGVEDEIASAFALHPHVSRKARDFAPRLSGEDSVAIHLRRGDYVQDERARAVHGVLDLSYYDDAIARVRASIPQARLFIASDDHAAAREAASNWGEVTLLDGESALDDLYLMSCARHHIIANSSFSWWSAWLDRREDGIRIAPKAWFSPEALRSRPTDDLIPATWEQL